MLEERPGSLAELVTTLVRVCRADSRLLKHPIAREWVRNARAFGARKFLRLFPRPARKGVRRPLTKRQIDLVAAVDDLRWGTRLGEYKPRGGMSLVDLVKAMRGGNLAGQLPRPRMPLRKVYERLANHPDTRALVAARHGGVMSYEYFFRLVADGEAAKGEQGGGQLGTLRA
ncbi:MAG: hypothetical protein FJ027_05085 [Candidatus Rokubacteria bacterium]|nr:hypothetical protein [Candidatus Rokubacteria bacterium]